MVALSGGRDRLVVIRADDGEPLAEFDFGFDEMLSPVWSPDGERLAFVGLRGGYSDLYVTDATGSFLTALTQDGWSVFQPAWSPDGGRIAFVTDRDYRSLNPEPTRSPWRIALLALATGEVSLLPNMAGKNINPQWFPDGGHLLYISDRTGISNLFVHDLETGRGDPAYRCADRGLGHHADRGGGQSVGERAPGGLQCLRPGGLGSLRDQGPAGRARRPPALAARRSGGDAAVGVGRDRGRGRLPTPVAFLADPDFVALPGGAARVDTLAGPENPERAGAPGAPAALGAPDSLAGADAVVPAEPLPAGDEAPETVRCREGPLPGRGPPQLMPRGEVDLAAIYQQTLVLPETLSVVEHEYRPRLSVDVAQAGGLYASGYGAIAQTLLTFSDMLGNRRLYVGADVSGSLEEGTYTFAYLNQRRRPAFLFSLYQYQTDYGYGTIPGYPDIYRKRLVRGGGIGLIYPLSRFRRLEFFLDGIYEKRYEWLCEEVGEDELWRCGWRDEHSDQLYAAPTAAMVFDSALFGSTGPLSGKRTRISTGLFVGERQASTATFDHRIYLNIRKRYALAWRLVAAGEWGRDPEQIAYGGPYSLRGYLDHPLAGTKIAFSNLELRFPFVDYLAIAWPLRFGIAGIRGSLFFDVGAAWDDPHDFRALRSGRGDGPFRLEDLHASCGLRTSLNIGFAILRWDLARRTDLAGWVGKAKGEFSMGWEF